MSFFLFFFSLFACFLVLCGGMCVGSGGLRCCHVSQVCPLALGVAAHEE